MWFGQSRSSWFDQLVPAQVRTRTARYGTKLVKGIVRKQADYRSTSCQSYVCPSSKSFLALVNAHSEICWWHIHINRLSNCDHRNRDIENIIMISPFLVSGEWQVCWKTTSINAASVRCIDGGWQGWQGIEGKTYGCYDLMARFAASPISMSSNFLCQKVLRHKNGKNGRQLLTAMWVWPKECLPPESIVIC